MIRLHFLTVSIAVWGGLASAGADLAAAPAPSGPGYDLRGPNPKKGDLFTVNEKSTYKITRRIDNGPDGPQTDVVNEITVRKSEALVLAVDGSQIVKMHTKILQDQRQLMRRGGRGRRGPTPTPGELSGMLIYSVLRKTGWKNAAEDAVPTERQIKALKEYVPFKEEDAFYPKEMIAAGQEWKIDPTAFEKVYGPQLVDAKGLGTGKLVRIDKKDGDDVAVIELQFDVTGASKEDNLLSDVKLKEKRMVLRSLKFGFDRKTTAESSALHKSTQLDGDQKVETRIEVVSSDEQTVELTTKSP